MKESKLAALSLVVLFVLASKTFSFVGPMPKVTICHSTGHDGWVKLSVDASAVDGEGNGDHNSSKHQDGKDIIPPGYWDLNGRNWNADGQAIWNNDCVKPKPTPKPTPTNIPEPTPTEEPEPTPIVTPVPQPLTEASAPPSPVCKDIRNRPTVIQVGRIDHDSIFARWTKVEDYVSWYLIEYGPSAKMLLWNTIVHGEYAELNFLPHNSHIWVRVAGKHEGCVGNFSEITDP